MIQLQLTHTDRKAHYKSLKNVLDTMSYGDILFVTGASLSCIRRTRQYLYDSDKTFKTFNADTEYCFVCLEKKLVE